MKINKNLIISFEDDIEIMRDKIYQNSVNHGWHEQKRSVDEYCALFHSEVSEVLEELREQNPEEIYFIDIENGEKIFDDKENFETMGNIIDNYDYNNFDTIKKYKPCGYGIEIADLVIRLLDFSIEYHTMPLEINNRTIDENYHLIENLNNFEIINILHNLICDIPYDENAFDKLILYCFLFVSKLKTDWSLQELIEYKHKFNLTRPKKHGKRF